MRTKPSIIFVHGIWADSGHVPMLSNPGVVIDVIRTAALALR
jgi:hypothetical protein